MQEDKYKSENDELRQLHLSRMARIQGNDNIVDETVSVTKIVNVMKEEDKKQMRNINQIYLNPVLYDKRPREERFHVLTLPQLLQPSVQCYPVQPVSSEVQAVMVTTYGFEMDIFEPIIRSRVPLFVFNRETDSKIGKVDKHYQGCPYMTVLSPPKKNMGYGVFHIKLWLIKFKTFLRVMVCTSNNHVFDWALWQNAYWFHDCPLKSNFKKDESPEELKICETKIDFDFEGDFIETLKWVIKEIQPVGYDVLKEMKINIDDYSFKDVRAILIPSLVDRLKGKQMQKVGLGKVRAVMKKAKIQFKNATLTANTSSLGRIDEKFVRELYTSFCPASGLFSTDKFKLVYPTERYIQEQSCGQADVLFLTAQNYSKCELKNHIFYKYEPSVFNGVSGGIPHLKTIVIQQKESQRVTLYVGSHNLTKAAWGTFQKNESQISCNNEELGLMFLDYSFEDLLQWLPYRYPAEKYGINEKPFIRQIL